MPACQGALIWRSRGLFHKTCPEKFALGGQNEQAAPDLHSDPAPLVLIGAWVELYLGEDAAAQPLLQDFVTVSQQLIQG